ncbi:MAG: hypothetical protein AAF193_04400 [Bacteroidota bacterium]
MAVNTPKDVAVRTALLITAVVVITVTATTALLSMEFNWIVIALTTLITFISAYLLVYMNTEKFIYQKVKIIYKTIHNFRSKDSKREVRMDEDVMEKVNKEVMGWAESKIAEISALK